MPRRCRAALAAATPIRRQCWSSGSKATSRSAPMRSMDRAAGTTAGRAERRKARPITIYRALDFLRDNGSCIASKAARLRRLRQQSRGGDLRGVPDLRALRRGRRSAVGAVADQLKTAAARRGFRPKAPVIEISRRLRALPAHEPTVDLCDEFCSAAEHGATLPYRRCAPSPACGGGLGRGLS